MGENHINHNHKKLKCGTKPVPFFDEQIKILSNYLGFLHLSTGIVKSVQHRGILTNKGNLQRDDIMS